jgi:hypothetical protein
MSDKGFLIITRPLFETALADYIKWKTSNGFSVAVKTAEEIETTYAGDDIRFKIRNCVRDYYYNRNTRYVLLIGDSDEISYPEGVEGLPTPNLAEPWSLPAGYYRVSSGPDLTTLFYSDLSDTIDYSSDNWYSGQYEIYVGIIPVRTVSDLKAILVKTINYNLAKDYISLFASDLSAAADWQKARHDQLVLLANGTTADITISQSLMFDQTSDQSTIDNALFERPGIIEIYAHGAQGVISIGCQTGLEVANSDGDKFLYINPLVILTDICWADAYAYNYTYPANPLGDCISEAWLKSAKGPAIIITNLPRFKISAENIYIDSLEEGFWKDLFAQKTIGEAFYNNCSGSTPLNPDAKGPPVGSGINLFGDPSLKIVASKLVDISWLFALFERIWRAILTYLRR